MTVWDDLVSAALVGVERRPFAVARMGALVDVPALDAAGAEAELLVAAAVLSAYRRAGRRPEKLAGGVPEPAPADSRPVCSDSAAQVLALLNEGAVKTAGGNDELIREWLAACDRAGRRPPERMLVALLELGERQPALRALVAAVTGPRGAWLGRANPAWAWAGGLAPPLEGETEAGHYETAPRAERVALLTRLRAQDPAGARELLASSWRTESAANRAALLVALATGLSDDDEPFLDDVLDDRAASVRAVAVDLLDQLPTSRRAQRMAARALPLVRVEGGLRPKLEVDLPAYIDAAGRRDGITDARPFNRGLSMEWLIQIVAATPLSTWDALGEPRDLVRMARDEPGLLDGWERAAVRQRDGRWAAALLAGSPNPDLVAALAPEEASAYLTEVLRTRPLADTAIVGIVAGLAGPWPAALSETLLERVAAMPTALVLMVVPSLATRLQPATLPLVNAWIDKASDDHLRRTLRQLAHTLSIRRTIQEEFA